MASEDDKNEMCEYKKFIFSTYIGQRIDMEVMELIWDYIISMSEHHIIQGREHLEKEYMYGSRGYSYQPIDGVPVAAVPFMGMSAPSQWSSGPTGWPEPTGININMMPFIYGQKKSLPNQYRQYWPLIMACRCQEQMNKVCYLTIQESFVEKNQSQRRPGAHVETPGAMKRVLWKPFDRTDGNSLLDFKDYCGIDTYDCLGDEVTNGNYYGLRWGAGEWNLGKPNGGIYFASNVDATCQYWRVLVDDPGECVWQHGDADHLKHLFGEPEVMKKDVIYWMTDRTPHEALPQPETGLRQFFRLVTSEVSLWFEEHSTHNSLGIKPKAEIIKVNKFKNYFEQREKMTESAQQKLNKIVRENFKLVHIAVYAKPDLNSEILIYLKKNPRLDILKKIKGTSGKGEPITFCKTPAGYILLKNGKPC